MITNSLFQLGGRKVNGRGVFKNLIASHLPKIGKERISSGRVWSYKKLSILHFWQNEIQTKVNKQAYKSFIKNHNFSFKQWQNRENSNYRDVNIRLKTKSPFKIQVAQVGFQNQKSQIRRCFEPRTQPRDEIKPQSATEEPD